MRSGKKNRKKRKVKGQTLRQMGLRLLIPIFLAMLGIGVCLSIELREMQKLANQYVEDTIGLYVEKINSDMLQINTELILEVKNNSNIKNIPDFFDSRQSEYYELLTNIKNQNTALKVRYKEVENFFVYAREPDVLIGDSGVLFSYSEASGIMKEIRDFSRLMSQEDCEAAKWDILEADQETYMIGWYAQHGKVIGCIMRLETIFSMLRAMPQEYVVIPFMEKSDGTVILSEKILETDYVAAQNNRNTEIYKLQLGTLGKLAVYVITEDGVLGRVMEMQLAVILFMVVFLGLCMLALWNYYCRLMKPLTQFVTDITKMEEEQMLNENGTNNILELEATSERFRELLRKIRSLKIAIYEKELSEKKAELEYLQEQIRPHFILNCLSLIHGMADAQGDEKIASIVKPLAEYIRYNYQDFGKVRELNKELAHVKTYVEIQKLRYGSDAFGFEILTDNLEDTYDIPPLVLQTLVENAIVHAVNLDTRVEISLYISSETYEDGSYLYISVSDTGKGFSKEVLEAVEKDLPIVYGGRKHVGLQNIKKRLKLLYGERAKMVIQNMDENYGAVVELRIPQDMEIK